MNDKNIIAAVNGAQMWDMRYKYPYEYIYKNEDGTEKSRATFYSVASAKCVAHTAEAAIALVKEFCPEAVTLGVHHREGGEKNRVLIDPAVLPQPQVTMSRPFTAEEIQQVLASEKTKPVMVVPGPPSLTDDERWFIERHIEYLIQWTRENGESTSVNQELQTYRGLLKRLGGPNG